MREQIIQNKVKHALTKQGHTVFRANVGKFLMKSGRWFDTGLPKGFPDLFGFNKDDGIFFAIEMKNEVGRLRPEQKKFAEKMKDQPIRYGVARSVEDALKIVEGK